MASQILPLRAYFPRYHQTCDRCDVEVDYGSGPTRKCSTYRDTAAGSFNYVFCVACKAEVGGKRPVVRENAYRKAMIRHAAKYSPEFAKFVAQWYGVKVTTKLLEA